MEKNDNLLEQVMIFLVLLVSVILVFTQYQLYKVAQNYWSYVAIVLILGLVGMITYLFVSANSSEHHETMKHEKPKPWTFAEKLSWSLVALVALMIIFNQAQISQASGLLGVKSPLTIKSVSTKTSLALRGAPTQDAIAIIIPRGVPFYGQELGVSFDDPIKSLEVIAQLDPSYGKNKIGLAGADKDRYISILTTPSMGCQYCCGADTSVTKDGRPTCGCKHSWAMRGLTAYLIKNYPQLSDDEIKREVSHWKGLFFPKQMIQKYIQETQSGKYTPDIASLLLDVDEKKLGEMKASVASNPKSQNPSTSADISELPSMVGGC